MVLTRCHTISKSIATYEDFGDRIDRLNDYHLDRVYKPRHERLHPIYRREEARKTKELVTIDSTTKSKEKITTLKATRHATSGDTVFTTTTLAADTSQVPELANTTLKPTMNLFKRIQHKFAWKNKTKPVKSTTIKLRHKKHKKKKKNETANFVGRDKRYLTTDNWDGNASFFSHLKTTTRKIKNLLFDEDSTSANIYDSDRTNNAENSDVGVDTKSYANNELNYPPPFTSPIEKNTVPQYLDDLDTFRGTASIETLLDKIKLHAMNIISEESPMVSEIITNTVTETTFDADPLLHSLPVTKYLEEPLILGDDNVELVESAENKKKTEASLVVHDMKTKATTMASNLEHKLQREIKDALKKAKNTLADGINKACDQVKSVTWKIMHNSANGLIDVASNTDTTKEMAQETTPISVITQDSSRTTLAQTQLATKSSSTQTKLTTLSTSTTTAAAKLTTRLNRATSSIGNFNENVETTTEDDYSMLKVFEDSLAKNHEDNVMKMLTIPTPVNKQPFKPFKDVFKVSKRDTETIENMNLKENIRKQNDGEGMPDEDYNVDHDKAKGNQISAEVYNDDDNPTTLTESTIRELATPDNSYAALSNKIHFTEFINGYKHYLNFARDLSKFDSNYSNRVCYQAHRHHNVDDIGKFILTKLPPIPDWKSTDFDSQRRDKRHFFDSTDLENNDVTTKSEESWFRKHFYIFHDQPSKKYHTEQTVTLKTKDAVQKKMEKNKNSSERSESNSGESDITTNESEGLELSWKTSTQSSAHSKKKTESGFNRWGETGQPSISWNEAIQPSIPWKETKEYVTEETQTPTVDDLSKEDKFSIRDKLSKLDKHLNDLMNKMSKTTAPVAGLQHTTSSPLYTLSTSMELYKILETFTPGHTTDFNLNELVSALVLKNYTATNRIKKWHSNSIIENPLNVINKLLSKSSHSNVNDINEDGIGHYKEVDDGDSVPQEISRIKRFKRDSNSRDKEFDYRKYTTPYSMLFDQAMLYPPSDDKHGKLGYVDLNLVVKPQMTTKSEMKKNKYKIFNKLKTKKNNKIKNKDKKHKDGKSRKERHSPLKMLKNLFKISQPYPDYSLFVKTEPNSYKFLKTFDIERSIQDFMKQVPNISQPNVTFEPTGFSKVPTENLNAIPIDMIMHPILTVKPESATYYRTMPKSDAALLQTEKSSMFYNNANKYTSVNLRASPFVEHTTHTPRLGPTRFHVTLTPVPLGDLMKTYIKYKTDSFSSIPKSFTNDDLFLDNPVLITSNPTPKLLLDIAKKPFKQHVYSTRDVTNMPNYITDMPKYITDVRKDITCMTKETPIAKNIFTNSFDSDFQKYGIQFHGLKNLQNVKDYRKLERKNYLYDNNKEKTKSYGIKTILLKNHGTQDVDNMLLDAEDSNNKKVDKDSTDEIQNLLYKKKEGKDLKSFGGFQNLMHKKIYNNFRSIPHSSDDGKYYSRIDTGKHNNKQVKSVNNYFNSVLQDNNALTDANKYFRYTKPTDLIKSTKPYKTYPDYFSDFFNWNSDILNMDHVTNPSIDEVMSTLMNATTAVDFIKLREDIRQMKSYLQYLTTRRTPLKQATPRTIQKLALASTKKHNPASLKKYNSTDKFRRGSIEKTKFESLDNLNQMINNINKLYSESFKKPKCSRPFSVPDDLDLHEFMLTPALNLDGTTTTENLPIDATVLAYDDGLGAIAHRLSPDRKFIRDDSGSKTFSMVKTKVNPLPKQYFMTPVPMQPTEFDQFLKENGFDIQNITSPYTEMSDFEDKWERSGSRVESKLMDVTDKSKKKMDVPTKLVDMEKKYHAPERSGKLFKSDTFSKAFGAEKYKTVTKTENVFSNGREPYAYLDDNTEYEEDNSYSRRHNSEIYDSKTKRKVTTSSPLTNNDTTISPASLHFDITIIDIDDIMKMSGAQGSNMDEGSTKASTIAQSTLPVTKLSEHHNASDDDTLDFSPVIERYPDYKVPENVNKIEQVNVPKNEGTEDSYTHHGDSFKFEDNLFKLQPKMKKKPYLNKKASKLKQSEQVHQTDLFVNPAHVLKINKSKTAKKNKAKINSDKAKHNDLLYNNLFTDKLTTANAVTLATSMKNEKKHQSEYRLKTPEHKHKTANSGTFKTTDDFKDQKSTVKFAVKPSSFTYETATQTRKFLGDDLFAGPKATTKMLNTNLTPKAQQSFEKRPKGLLFSSNTMKYAVYFDDTEGTTVNSYQQVPKHTPQPTGKNRYDQMSKMTSTTTMKTEEPDSDVNKILKEILGNTGKPGRRRRALTTTIAMKTEEPDSDVNKLLKEILGKTGKSSRRLRKAMWRKWKTTPMHKPNDNRETKNDQLTSKTAPSTTNNWFWFLSRKRHKEENSTTSPMSGSTSVLVINTNKYTSSPIITGPVGYLEDSKKREQRGGDSLIYVVDVLEGSNYSKRVSSATSLIDDKDHTLTPGNITFMFPARVANEDGKALLNKGDEIFVEKPWSTTLQHHLPRFKPYESQEGEETQRHTAEKKPDQSQPKQVQTGQSQKEQSQASQLQAAQSQTGQPQKGQSQAGQLRTGQELQVKSQEIAQMKSNPAARPQAPDKAQTPVGDKTCESCKPLKASVFLEVNEPNDENSLNAFEEIGPSNVTSMNDMRQPDKRLVFQEPGIESDFPWTAKVSPQYNIATIVRSPDSYTTTDKYFDESKHSNALDFEGTTTLNEFVTDKTSDAYTIESDKNIFPSESPELETMDLSTRTTTDESMDVPNLENQFSVLKELDSKVSTTENDKQLLPTVQYNKHEKSTSCCTLSSLKLSPTKFTLDFGTTKNINEMSRELVDMEKEERKIENLVHQGHLNKHPGANQEQSEKNIQNSTEMNRELSDKEEEDKENEQQEQLKKNSQLEQSEQHIQKEIDKALDKIEAAEANSLTSKKPQVAEDEKLTSTRKHKPVDQYQTTTAKTNVAKTKLTTAAKLKAAKNVTVQAKHGAESKNAIEPKIAQTLKETEAKKALEDVNKQKFKAKTTKVNSGLSSKENYTAITKAISKITSTSTRTTLPRSSKKNMKQTSTRITTIATKPATTKAVGSAESKKPKTQKSKIFKRQTAEPYNTIFTAKDVAALEVIVDLMKEPGERASATQTTKNSYNGNFDCHPSTSAIQVHIGVPYFMQDKKRSALEPPKVRKVFSAKMSVPVDIEYQVRSLDNSDKMISTYTGCPNKSGLSPGMYLLVEDAKQNQGFALKPVIRQIKQDLVTSTVKTDNPKSLSRVTLSKDYIESINKQLIQLYQNLTTLDNTTRHTIKRSFEDNRRTRYRRKISWDKVLEYIGHGRVCNCKCVPNKPMCRSCAASDAVMSELMFEFENLSEYMRDHCTEIQTFFWMNPTAGRKLRDIVQKIDKSVNDYYKRVKGKCQGRPCSCVEKREFTEPVVENYDTYIQKSLFREFEDLALSLRQVQKLKLNCNEKFKNIVDRFVKISKSCTKEYKDKRSLPTQKVYSLDNINVNIICNDNNPSFHEISTLPDSTNDVSTSDFSILDYTDDEVKQKKTTKSFKQMFAKRRGKRAKIKPTKRDAIVQIESPVVVSDTNSLWKEYLKDAKITSTMSSERPVNIKPVVSLGVLEKTNKNTVTLNPTLKATLVKIDDTDLNNSNDFENENNTDVKNEIFLQMLPNRFSRNGDKFKNVDQLTTKPESLSQNMKELIKIFESLPGGQEVKFTAGYLKRLTTKPIETPSKDNEISITVKSITDPVVFKETPNINLPHVSVTTITSSSSLKARNSVGLKNSETTTSNNNLMVTQLLPQFHTTNKESWFKKIKNKVVMITPVFENKKMPGKTNKNIKNAPTNRAISNKNELKAVAMNANIHVNSYMTTTSFPTLFIIEDVANHVATKNIDQRDSLLLNVMKYEKDTIDSKLTKIKKRDNFKLEDEINDILLMQQDKPRVTAKTTTELEYADGDYCLCNRLKKLKSILKETVTSPLRDKPTTTPTPATVATNKLTTTTKVGKRKSFLRLFMDTKKKQKTDQRVVDDKERVHKKEKQRLSSPEFQLLPDEQQRIRDDMKWFLAQFASTILYESTSSIAYLDKLTEMTPDEFEDSTSGTYISDIPLKKISSIYNQTPVYDYTTTTSTISKVKDFSSTTTIIPKKTVTISLKEKTTIATPQKTSPKTRTIKIVTSTHTTNTSSSITTPILTSEPSLSKTSSTTKSSSSAITTVKTTKSDIVTKKLNTLEEEINKLEKTVDTMSPKDTTKSIQKTTTPLTTKKHLETLTSKKEEKHTTQVDKTKTKKLKMKLKSYIHEPVPQRESTSESGFKKVLNKGLDRKNNLKEACDLKTEACLCDIRATSDHVLDRRRTMSKKDFEVYVRNLTCYRYMKPPPFFLLEPWKRTIRKHEHQKQKRFNKYFDSEPLQKSIRWDWIRKKRELLSVNDYESDTDFGELSANHEDADDNSVDNGEKFISEANVDTDVNAFQGHEVNSDDDFEKLYKGEDNVYRAYKKRQKRTTGDMQELIRELKDLPPLQSRENELFAMLGDKMSLDCLHRSRSYKSDTPVFWDTERTNMLAPPDAVIDGPMVILKKVHARHTGNYTCSQDGKTKTVKLTVVTLPQFFVVFIPMYSSKHGCSYDDLRAMQRLGPLMTNEHYACARNSSSIKIDEPICLEDKDDGSIHLRATAILTACRHPGVHCSAQCRRDMQCAFALLCAANTPVLYNVQVVVARQGYNKTLVPSFKSNRRLVVTHTLRKKELPKHPEYHQLAASMYPGNLDIVVSCPAGYYLLPKQKICVACPADTCAGAGENTCHSCAAGTSAEPGSARCKLSLRKMRRYDWWWYPPCGFALAGVGVLCACVVCTACSLAAHVTSRSTARAHAAAVSVARADSRVTRSQHYATKRFSSTSGATRGGPPSPSAVILARFFRASASSSRATDSQETKFEIWKEKNNPPPLPPIDFDLG